MNVFIYDLGLHKMSKYYIHMSENFQAGQLSRCCVWCKYLLVFAELFETVQCTVYAYDVWHTSIGYINK